MIINEPNLNESNKGILHDHVAKESIETNNRETMLCVKEGYTNITLKNDNNNNDIVDCANNC